MRVDHLNPSLFSPSRFPIAALTLFWPLAGTATARSSPSREVQERTVALGSKRRDHVRKRAEDGGCKIGAQSCTLASTRPRYDWMAGRG